MYVEYKYAHTHKHEVLFASKPPNRLWNNQQENMCLTYN